MVNKTLTSIILASSLLTNSVFGQNEEKTVLVSNQENLLKTQNLTSQDYKVLSEDQNLSIRGNPTYGVKVYTPESGNKAPEYIFIRTQRKVQMYYPAKNK